MQTVLQYWVPWDEMAAKSAKHKNDLILKDSILC